jgi:hypothetical protein
MSTLTHDLAHSGATFVVVTTTAPVAPHETFALAAVAVRIADTGFERVGRLHCAVNPAARVGLVLERSGLRPDQIEERAPAEVALAYLDARLTRPPYVVLAYGPLPGRQITAHHASCLVLAALPRLDIQRLERHLRGHDWSPALERARPDPAAQAPAPREAEFVAGLFEHLVLAAAAHTGIADLPGLLEVARDHPAAAPMPDRPTASLGAPRPTGAMR